MRARGFRRHRCVLSAVTRAVRQHHRKLPSPKFTHLSAVNVHFRVSFAFARSRLPVSDRCTRRMSNSSATTLRWTPASRVHASAPSVGSAQLRESRYRDTPRTGGELTCAGESTGNPGRSVSVQLDAGPIAPLHAAARYIRLFGGPDSPTIRDDSYRLSVRTRIHTTHAHIYIYIYI